MFVTDFMNILKSFNLKQAIQEPTHSKGQTLDLVLYSSLSPDNSEIKDICVSDPSGNLWGCTMKPMRKCQKPQFLERPLEATKASHRPPR